MMQIMARQSSVSPSPLWLVVPSLLLRKDQQRLILPRRRCQLMCVASKTGAPPSCPRARWQLARCPMLSLPRRQRRMFSATCAGWCPTSMPRICRSTRISLTISMSQSMARPRGLVDSTRSTRPAGQPMDGANLWKMWWNDNTCLGNGKCTVNACCITLDVALQILHRWNSFQFWIMTGVKATGVKPSQQVTSHGLHVQGTFGWRIQKDEPERSHGWESWVSAYVYIYIYQITTPKLLLCVAPFIADYTSII